MISWLIVAVYWLGWAYTTVAWARHRKDRWASRVGLAHARAEQGWDLVGAAALATLWPFWTPFWAIRSVTRGRLVARIMYSQAERDEDERNARRADMAELATLRRQAQALGLPYPEGDR